MVKLTDVCMMFHSSVTRLKHKPQTTSRDTQNKQDDLEIHECSILSVYVCLS